jgi:hypothetical protein
MEREFETTYKLAPCLILFGHHTQIGNALHTPSGQPFHGLKRIKQTVIEVRNARNAAIGPQSDSRACISDIYRYEFHSAELYHFSQPIKIDPEGHAFTLHVKSIPKQSKL